MIHREVFCARLRDYRVFAGHDDVAGLVAEGVRFLAGVLRRDLDQV